MNASKEPKKQDRAPVIDPDAEPDFAEEAAPKTTEFSTKRDAKEITAGEFDRIP